MKRDAFLIKIIPPKGRSVYRLHLSRWAVAVIATVAVALLFGAWGFQAWRLHVAADDMRQLQAQAAAQQERLVEVDRQAGSLAGELQALVRRNAEIRRLLDHGTGPPKPAALHADVVGPGGTPTVAVVQERLAEVAAQSQAAAADEQHLARLTHRVLNLRRLAQIARDRMIAAIPSINPVGGGIASAFGYRLSPWPEFHSGVDLEADFGTPVHAAADGVVAAAGWESGFGNMVDIDHGNGYHTWYAHLSRFAVAAGRRVHRGDVIAFVGMTGDATGPHLHYQLMQGDRPIDPAPFLNGVPAAVLATLPAPSNVH